MPLKFGVDRRYRLPRIWSNEELRRIAPLVDGDVVNVSAWRDEDKQGGKYRNYFIGAKSYTRTNWVGERGAQTEPDELLINLEEPLPDEYEGRFDVVFNHTTLEHVFHVFTAFESLVRLSRDLVIVVVPCCQAVHYLPDFGDYWRFTPLTLRRLCERHGLTPIYESVTPEAANASIYCLLVASKHPERWRDRLPHQHLGDVYPGTEMVRNDPFTLFASWCYTRLSRWKWYRRWSKEFARRHLERSDPNGETP